MNKPSLSQGFAFITAIIVFLIIAILMTYETYLENSNRITRQMESEATRIDRALIIEIEHSSHLLQGMGQEITHMNPDDLNGIAFLLRSFDTTATIHHVISWIGADNRNVVSSNKGVHNPVDVSDSDYVKAAFATPWKIQIGNPINGRVSNIWALPVALGITDATGKYIGTIEISMDIYTISHDLQRVIKQSGISFTIYSKSLLPLMQKSDEENLLKFDGYRDRLKSINLNQAPSGLLSRASPFDSSSMYVYYELSATYPYVLVLGYDNAASNAALWALLLPRLTELFLLGVFMLSLLWLVRLRIIKPIAVLADYTRALINGERPPAPDSTGGVEELNALARQIRRLHEYIAETRRIEEENKNKNIILRNSKEAADLSNRIKIEFLISMSHALRTPLNTILGFSEIMKRQGLGFENKQHLQYIKDIHEAAQQLKALTEDMQKLSSAELGMGDLQEKHIDIRFILSKCVRTVSKILQDNRLHVELRLPDVMPRLLMDEQRLEQIIVNIIMTIISESNAVGHIIIRTYTESDAGGNETLCIAFTDTGATAEEPDTNGRQKGEDPAYIGVPLTRALLAMHHAQLEVKTAADKPDLVIIRFPKERLVY